MRLDWAESKLSAAFGGWSRIVTRWPGPFVLLPLLLTAVLLLGLVRNPVLIKDHLDLYTPTNAPALKDLGALEALFPINDQDPYYYERRYETERLGYVLVISEPEGRNILNPVIVSAVSDLWDQMTAMRIEKLDGESFSYHDICVRVRLDDGATACIQNPLVKALEADERVVETLTYPVSQQGWYLPQFLGGVAYNKSRHLESARAILLPYQLRHGTGEEDAAAEAWEMALSRLLADFRDVQIQALWWTSETLPSEAARDRSTLVHLLAPLFAVVTGFTVVCCLMGNSVQSRPWLGLAGVVSAALAILSAIGALLLAGHKFTSVAYCMPFIVFSIGVDNVFILLGAWRKSGGWKALEERMADTWADAGVSITVTSLTDALSFGVGCFATFPSVRIFCIYAATAICFVYLYQLTFLAALMALTSRREVEHRSCITFRVVPKHKVRPIGSQMGTAKSRRSGSAHSSDVETNHALARFFRGPYASLLMQPFARLVIITAFLGYLAIALWGCTGMKLGLEPIDLLPGDSYGRRTLRLYERYFMENGAYLHVWVSNLSSLRGDAAQRPWIPLSQEMELYEHTEFSGYADSWLRVFLAFVRAAGLLLTPDNFAYILRNVFLKTPQYEKYGRDVLFDAIGDRLEAVRFPIHLRYVGMANQSRAMTFFRRLAAQSELDVHVYSDFFRFAEQYEAVLPGTLANVGVAGAAVILVSLLLIPQPLAALWVSLTIISINIGILGLMSMWDVHLDFVSMVTIVMSIGFCVDFSAHLAYHFAIERNGSAETRLRAALYAVGTPILQSAASTLIGVSFLAAVDSYVFRSFLKTIILVISLGTFHGLIILPVLLTLFHCGGSGDSAEGGAYASNSGAGSSADSSRQHTPPGPRLPPFLLPVPPPLDLQRSGTEPRPLRAQFLPPAAGLAATGPLRPRPHALHRPL